MSYGGGYQRTNYGAQGGDDAGGFMAGSQQGSQGGGGGGGGSKVLCPSLLPFPITSAQQQQQQKPQRENRMETMVEDTVMSMDGEGEGDAKREEEEEEDDFEVMATPQTQTVFERAVHGKEKVRQMAHMSIFLSRIPIPELKVRENFAVQSNEEYINHVQRKRAGLAA